jgi:hypothetical protein
VTAAAAAEAGLAFVQLPTGEEVLVVIDRLGSKHDEKGRFSKRSAPGGGLALTKAQWAATFKGKDLQVPLDGTLAETHRLTYDEMIGISLYTSGRYVEVNQQLRGWNQEDAWDTGRKKPGLRNVSKEKPAFGAPGHGSPYEGVKALDKMIKDRGERPPEVLWRGIDTYKLPFDSDLFKVLKENSEPGASFKDEGYGSTSTDPSTAAAFTPRSGSDFCMIRLHTSPQARALRNPLNDSVVDENEWILPRGGTFILRGVSRGDVGMYGNVPIYDMDWRAP